ncbi:MAG: SDR family oxidoreductase [Rudaea sp.]
MSGKIILVTGGAKGIGRGISESFLARGAQVVACGREMPAELPRSGDAQARFIVADVRDADAVERLFVQIEADYGGLDVLVSNAGGAPFALADSASPRFHEAIIRLNLIAPLLLAQRANAIMQKRAGGGTIVFVASVSGLRASPGTAAYGAAKAGVLSLVQSLAVEWAPKVRVVAVSPGLVHTEKSALHYGDEQGIAQVAATVPLQRMATPADIGAVCAWLASSDAGYVSGANLLVHGGGERPAFLAAATANIAPP